MRSRLKEKYILNASETDKEIVEIFENQRYPNRFQYVFARLIAEHFVFLLYLDTFR